MINEFKNTDKTYLNKIKELIFFDDIWRFPEYSIIEYLKISDNNLPSDFLTIANKIVDILNNENVQINDFTEKYNEIITIK